ncbi:lysozyme inhibitor LprI family protein [Simplicispira psychrophila]|uniref:lysozyme inhibitor LprI family protein n=1 Tax=Simplicispira psychrophila TaxID=80882 RepID=UPI00048324D9|nr:lysozyme inhibitor LprI family protein [Simplicispira psychrophila]
MNAITTYCTAVVLACASLTASAQDAALSPQYATCMDQSGGVTVGMIDCTTAETSRQDARLNRAYKTAMAAQSPERRKQLQTAQRAWIKFRDANCDFYNDPDGGSMARVSANQCMLTSTANRAQEIEKFSLE